MESTWQSVSIMRNNQYWLYLVNESNMITKLFYTGFACDGTMYTYVDNVLVSTSIILFYIYFCSFSPPEHESKVPAGSASANL